VFVRKLRQKLQRHSASWRYIHTHFGIGYRFDPEPLGEMGTETALEAAAEGPSAEEDQAEVPLDATAAS
jgi:hypothetical protein